MLSPLEEHNKLIKKIKHTKNYDPELSDTRVAKRHKTGTSFVKQVMRGEKTYPGYYRQISKTYKLDVDEVLREMEAGNRYCLRCEAWASKSEFYRQSQGSYRHMGAYCKGVSNNK